MNDNASPITKLLTKLELESISTNEFVGGSGVGGATAERGDREGQRRFERVCSIEEADSNPVALVA